MHLIWKFNNKHFYIPNEDMILLREFSSVPHLRSNNLEEDTYFDQIWFPKPITMKPKFIFINDPNTLNMIHVLIWIKI